MKEGRMTSNQWRTVILGDVATIERSSLQPHEIESGTTYVGLEHIESGGAFLDPKPVEKGSLASSKFKFTDRHILYGKLRPYLAKIACPDFSGICSTDILPILPSEKLERRYLFHFLRQPSMVSHANSHAVGVNLPRLSPTMLAQFEIPLPPVSEQRRIADILDRAEVLRATRRAALVELDALIQSIFFDLFRDLPVSDAAPLADVAQLKRGPFGGSLRKEIFVDVGYKVYEQRNAIYDDFGMGRYFITESKFREMEHFAIKPRDLIVSCSGTLGKVAIVPEDVEPGIINQALLRVRPDPICVTPLYLKHALETREVQTKLAGLSHGTGLQNFPPMSHVRSLRIRLPSLELQSELARRVAAVEKLKTSQRASLKEMDALFASLQHRAFNGELWSSNGVELPT